MILKNSLKNLVDELIVYGNTESNEPSISIYMPCKENTVDPRYNKITFQNLLTKVYSELINIYEKEDAEKILLKATNLLNHKTFWLERNKSLAIFISNDFLWQVDLPFEIEPFAKVMRKFYLIPLIELLNRNVVFYLLSISIEDMQLFMCDNFNFKEINLPEDAKKLVELTKFVDYEKPSLLCGGIKGHHGEAPESPDKKSYLTDYLSKTDHFISKIINDKPAPLILAGPEYLVGFFKKISHCKTIHEETILKNFPNLKFEELHEEALAITKKLSEEKIQKELEQFYIFESKNKKLISENKVEILKSAFDGSIKHLFVPKNYKWWGVYEKNINLIDEKEREEDNLEELVNLASLTTLKNGGNLTIAPEGAFLKNKLTAIFRYPKENNYD